jgi:hypothetical protein
MRSIAPTEAGDRMLGQLRPLPDGFDAALEPINAYYLPSAANCANPCHQIRGGAGARASWILKKN